MTSSRRTLLSLLAGATAVSTLAVTTTAGAATGAAPGGPGAAPSYLPSDKQGFGTSHTTGSKVWFTLEAGQLSEVYYPDLGTPATRELGFVVSDGSTFAERDTTATTKTATLLDGKGLTYRQVDTERSHRWRITKTYVTDPDRATVLVDVTFQSLTGKPYAVYAYFDPTLSNNGKDYLGTSTASGALIAHDATSASALEAAPAFTRTSSGFVGTSDGWTDLKTDRTMDWTYNAAGPGNIAQLGLTTLDGTARTSLTLALGFGPKAQVAQATASKSLRAGFPATAKKYALGWNAYLKSLKKPPAMPTARERTEYRSSELILAASEDKANRGAYVASPTMPWAWGTGLDNPSGAYHLVWSRDLYEIATALIAEGDTSGANRALTYLFTQQQRNDGAFPQNSTVDGSPHWGGLQLDEVADPIILAWQLHRTGAKDWAHVRRAADFLVSYVDKTTHKKAPWSPQERWENQASYSPATIAAEIAGLVTAAAIAHLNHADAKADAYLAVADKWQSAVKRLTATSTGPYSSKPYFLRLTKDGQPNKGTRYDIGDSGPNGVDQRRVVDPSFLELVRLGVLPANDPVVLNTLTVVDKQLMVKTPSGTFWHRYTFDGYGETKSGGQWDIGFKPGSQTTNGRAWPIFAGERGEYNLLAGKSAASELSSMAKAASSSMLLPEQVWDRTPPSGTAGHLSGTPTLSATPLTWSHAQFIRLAWSIKAGTPVEQPAVVACRYVGC